ncbi:hypothetical protein HPULCUR_002219 [Helicostylum pulchrum]|uniref:RBR-type E3 ubiquitin transferase n=1 Tax=Helicostylum pulchrum TaxID=562976 RepID=A0ABP9XQ29_9FUNG
MLFETEGSSEASSYADHDEIESFVDRCSICFYEQLDLCLDGCKDQFCHGCFQRYIVDVVKSSWGLSVTPISCPVCTELIPKHEWSRYVPQSITDTYDKFNKPYRSYIRTCHHCETDLIPCVYPNNKPNNSKVFCDLMENMLQTCEEGEEHKNHTEHISVKRWLSINKRQDWSDTKLPTHYKQIMNNVITFESKHAKFPRFAYQISIEYLNLCENPEIWKQLQFAHIRLFRDMKCFNCKASICLHCGYDSHINTGCEENMRNISKILKDKTIKWKIQHSRQCPNCSIMINRDEGCNKVDCSYCGFCFCWACRSSWSERFVFYGTELGVPNIKNIQARLITPMDLD